MLKLHVAAAAGLFWGAVAAAGCGTSHAPVLVRTVDLNESGVLEMLQGSNPGHYEKIRRILDNIHLQQDANVPRWIQTNFKGRDVTYAPVVLTSYPPKRRLSFALDSTRYEAIIVLTDVRGEIGLGEDRENE
jgi:hypothetical protein